MGEGHNWAASFRRICADQKGIEATADSIPAAICMAVVNLIIREKFEITSFDG
jgi:hypothetical protein